MLGVPLQLNGNESVQRERGSLVLRHSGLVTVRHRIARPELLERMAAHAPEAISALGGIDFPFLIGSTANVGAMLDRLFLYAYAVEQAKRAIRGESSLSALFPKGQVEQALIDYSAKRGQGFGRSAAFRSAIEQHAMKCAEEHLRETWPEIEDTSATEPYDLRCRRGEQTLFVEVKGTTRDGSTILVTRNEVEHARSYPDSSALIVVSHIAVSESADGSALASGGSLRQFLPWRVEEADLMPLTYACTLPPNGA